MADRSPMGLGNGGLRRDQTGQVPLAPKIPRHRLHSKLLAQEQSWLGRFINVESLLEQALSLGHVLSGSVAVMAQGQSNFGVQVYDKANLKAKWGN